VQIDNFLVKVESKLRVCRRINDKKCNCSQDQRIPLATRKQKNENYVNAENNDLPKIGVTI
jgi:hypothetical protein